MQKSPDFVGQQNRPILSAKIEHVLSSTILSADILYIGQQIFFFFCHGDCLQQKMNIYFSYLLCLLFIFRSSCRKKVTQVLFCDLHSALVLADIVQSSRQKILVLS